MKTAKQRKTFILALKDKGKLYWENYGEFTEAIEKVKYEAANNKLEDDELVGYHNLNVSDLQYALKITCM